MTVAAAQSEPIYFIRSAKISLSDYHGLPGTTTIKVKLECNGERIKVRAFMKSPQDAIKRRIPLADIVWCNPEVTPKLFDQLVNYLHPRLEVVKQAAGRTVLKISFPSPKSAVAAPLAARQDFADAQAFEQALIQRIAYEAYRSMAPCGLHCAEAMMYTQKIGRLLGLGRWPRTALSGYRTTPLNATVRKYTFYRSVLKIGRYFELCLARTVGPDDLTTLQQGASLTAAQLCLDKTLLQLFVKRYDAKLCPEAHRKCEKSVHYYAKAIATANKAPTKLIANLFSTAPLQQSILRAAFLVQDRQGRMRFYPANALDNLIALANNRRRQKDLQHRLLTT